jgi:Mn-dependent DtxR family transcriptional regulator
MSTATKYAKAILDADIYLRRRAANGSRVQCTRDDIAEELSVVGTTASTVLAELARMNTGLTSLGKGKYEYKTPSDYPKTLKELKDNMRNPPEPASHPYLRSEVLEWYNSLKPGTPFTYRTVSDALDAKPTSVAGIVRDLFRAGVIEQIKGGMYRKPLPPMNTVVVDTLAGLRQQVMNRAVDEATEATVSATPWKEDPEDEGTFGTDITITVPAESVQATGGPTPRTMAQAVDRRVQARTAEAHWEEVGPAKDGDIILRSPEGTPFRASPL